MRVLIWTLYIGIYRAAEGYLCYYIAMTTWYSGRESRLLDEIITGRKTIEGRLRKGKFTDYKVGDIVALRRDIRDKDGVLHDGEPGAAMVEVVAVRGYPDFLTMVEVEGFQCVIPFAASAKAAADEYNRYYSAADQARYGVLAIEVRVIGSGGAVDA